MESILGSFQSSLALTGDESHPFFIDPEPHPPPPHLRSTGRSFLFVKVLAPRPINPRSFANGVQSIWQFVHVLSVKPIENNKFLIAFDSPEDRDRIIEGQPWAYDSQAMILVASNHPISPSTIEFDSILLWVRIYDLPIGCISEDTARRILEFFGEVIDIDFDTQFFFSGSFLHGRIRFDVSKPIRRGIRIGSPFNSEPEWYPAAYERIPKFCYQSGFLDHILKDCKDKPHNVSACTFPYEDSLRVSPANRTLFPKLGSDRTVLSIPSSSELGGQGSSPTNKVDEAVAPSVNRRSSNRTVMIHQTASSGVSHVEDRDELRRTCGGRVCNRVISNLCGGGTPQSTNFYKCAMGPGNSKPFYHENTEVLHPIKYSCMDLLQKQMDWAPIGKRYEISPLSLKASLNSRFKTRNRSKRSRTDLISPSEKGKMRIAMDLGPNDANAEGVLGESLRMANVKATEIHNQISSHDMVGVEMDSADNVVVDMHTDNNLP